MEKEDSKQEASSTQAESVGEKKNDESKGQSEADHKKDSAQHRGVDRYGWGKWTTLERTERARPESAKGERNGPTGHATPPYLSVTFPTFRPIAK
jgi:hypothetical protein